MNALAPDILSSLILKWDRFTLGNGLRVVVHSDRRLPVVTIDVTYLVGSKDEEAGQSGLAHLFEHLMFTGTEALPGPFMARLIALGALDVNAETSNDVTNYRDVVPSGMLEFALYAEADRMGTFDQALARSALDQQRSIVLQEKGEREPFSRAMMRMSALAFAPEHPYRRSVIGEDADLIATTLDDARRWYKRFYGPSNAVLTICGDVDIATVKPMVERYFASIPPGPALRRDITWVPAAQPQRHVRLEEPAAKVSNLKFSWVLPGTGHPDVDLLELFFASIASNDPGMLRDQLVTRDGVASHIGCSVDRSNVLCCQAFIDVAFDDASSARTIETAIRTFMRRMLERPIDETALDRLKIDRMKRWARDIKGLEYRARILAFGESRFGDPDNHVLSSQRMMLADSAAVLAAVRRWLSGDPVILEIVPFTPKPATIGLETSAEPLILKAPAILTAPHRPFYPKVEHAVLSNGLRVVVATDFECDSTSLRVASDIGYSNEQPAKRGLLAMAQALRLNGAGDKDKGALQDLLSSHSIINFFGMSATSSTMDYIFPLDATDTVLDLFVNIVTAPHFLTADLEVYRDTTIKSLRQARSDPSVLRPVQMEQLFGRGHPLTWSQTGTVASVASLGMEDVAASHRALWDPSRTTVFCAGGLSLDRLVAVLERNAGSWPRCRDRLMYPIAVPPPQPSPNSLAILEDAGRAVCSVKAARLLTADASSDLAGLALSHAVGGTMNSRLMHRLREERGWAYGGGSDILSLGRPDIEQVLSIHTGVPTQHAAATVSDIMALVDAAAGAEPISLQERNLFVAARERHVYQALRDPGRIVASMQRQLSANRQLGGWAAEFEALGALTVESIRSAAESMFSSSGFSWTITGDVASIENQFASSGPRDVELFRWDITKDGD